tara:strand:+ start:5161 stop:5670 length:510 start_codon:yes stop_codon:yes gene_type:complete
MKGSIDSGTLHVEPLVLLAGTLFLVGLIWFIGHCRRESPVAALHALRRNSSLVIDDAGETSTEHLYDISISATQEYFDLNLIYGALLGAGCRVMSTADSNHPNHRRLSLAIPKRSGSSLSLWKPALFGIVGGVIVFNMPVLYNSFHPYWESLRGRFDDFLDAQTDTFGQ